MFLTIYHQCSFDNESSSGTKDDTIQPDTVDEIDQVENDHMNLIVKETLQNEQPKSFHLVPKDKIVFIETRKSPEFKEKIDFLNGNNLSLQDLTAKITELLIETCDKSGIKSPQNQNKG